MEKFRITEITRFILLNDLIRVFNSYVLYVIILKGFKYYNTDYSSQLIRLTFQYF